MADTKTVELGDMVEYRDGNGFRKAALVTATPETIAPETYLEAPEAGTVHLKVFSPGGAVYDARSIPAGEGPHTFTAR